MKTRLAARLFSGPDGSLRRKGKGKQILTQASTTGSIPAQDQSGTRVSAIAMYCVLLLAYALMAGDRFLFPFLGPDIRRDLGFSVADTGLLSTIFTLGLGIGGLPTGFLLSRFSRKLVLQTGIIIFSAGTALTVVMTGFWSMLICLALTGIGMAMMATVMFALAASYFVGHRGAAVGSVNFCYGIGGFLAPNLARMLLGTYKSWHAPMIAFGLFGFLLVGVIALTVRSWFSETRGVTAARKDLGGAPSLLNRNTVILTFLSIIHGLILYGFLGMYPTFLREGLHYAPKNAAFVYSFFGMGALLSIAGGFLGDRFSPKVVLGGAFLGTAVLGYLFFHGPSSVAVQATLTCAYGAVASATLYVNLAGYHVKALRANLASRGSGMFVTTLYGSSAVAGYLMGGIVSHAGGIASLAAWMMAGNIQIVLFSIFGAILATALRPDQMSR